MLFIQHLLEVLVLMAIMYTSVLIDYCVQVLHRQTTNNMGQNQASKLMISNMKHHEVKFTL